MSIQSDIIRADIGEVWEGYEVVDNPAVSSTNYYLTSYADQPILWRGNVYQPFPIQLVGVSSESTRATPRPTLRVSNVDGAIFPFIGVEDFVGATVTRWRTLVKYLPGQPAEDPNQHFPTVKYRVLSRQIDSDRSVNFQLSVINDRPQARLPRRVVLRQDGVPNTVYAPAVGLAGARAR